MRGVNKDKAWGSEGEEEEFEEMPLVKFAGLKQYFEEIVFMLLVQYVVVVGWHSWAWWSCAVMQCWPLK